MSVDFLTSFTNNAALPSRAPGISPEPSVDFGSAVKKAIDSVDATQKSAETEMTKAVTGENPELHKTIIALQTADLKFQFGLQVRNKLIGAYEEVMRMQV